MTEGKDNNNNLLTSISSYTLMTSKRLLDTFQIHLSPDDLIATMNHPTSLYHSLLKVPINNIQNGLIIDQTKAYQTYVQKSFIDYLLSGEANENQHTSGSQTRQKLEKKRQELLQLGERFYKEEQAHYLLIAESQKYLISFTRGWVKTIDHSVESASALLKKSGQEIAISDLKSAVFSSLSCLNRKDDNQLALVQELLKSLSIELDSDQMNQLAERFLPILNEFKAMEPGLEPFLDKTQRMTNQCHEFRKQFYDLILQVNELMRLVSGYQSDSEQVKINKEALNFDAGIV